MKLRDRRKRSPNGQRRASTIHRFRDLDPLTEVRIRVLARRFGVPMGSILDAAIATYFEQALTDGAQPDTDPEDRERASARLKTLEAWLTMRQDGDPELPAEGLAELDAELAARRSKLLADLSRLDGTGSPEGEG